MLATLGKALESVVAEIISYVVETLGLLPMNHFGVRKKRSTEQALLLLQEHIYNAFCSEHTATILVNGYTAEKQQLPQAGLPQGSPLAPILFLFFNADLVQQGLNRHSTGRAEQWRL